MGAAHLRLRFQQALALGRLSVAWAAAALLSRRDVWQRLGDAAVHALHVDLAIRFDSGPRAADSGCCPQQLWARHACSQTVLCLFIACKQHCVASVHSHNVQAALRMQKPSHPRERDDTQCGVYAEPVARCHGC